MSLATPLTPAQKTTLKTYINAQPDLQSQPNSGDGNAAIATALNVVGAPATPCWRMVTPTMLKGGVVDVSELDNLTQGKRDALTLCLNFFGGFDATTAAGNKAITDIFPTSGNTRNQVLAIGQENATRGELVFLALMTTLVSAGTGQNAISGKVRVVKGAFVGADIADVRNNA